MQSTSEANTEIEIGAFENRAARSLLRHPVAFTVKGLEGTFEAECSNVSCSGMFLKGSSRPPVGSDITFRFFEQGIVLIQGEARVARHVETEGKMGVGVFFTSLDPLARRMIDRVVALNAEDAQAAAAAAAPPEPAAETSLDLGASPFSLDMD